MITCPMEGSQCRDDALWCPFCGWPLVSGLASMSLDPRPDVPWDNGWPMRLVLADLAFFIDRIPVRISRFVTFLTTAVVTRTRVET